MKIAEFSVKNYPFTIVIFLMVLVLGLSSLMNMPRGEDPPFNAPIFIIVAVYPGTSPSDMEQLVVDKLEENMSELEDIKRIISTADDGMMMMRVEFNYGTDINVKNNDVIREVNRIRPELPAGLLSLDVIKASSSDVAILQVALVSENVPYPKLRESAEKLEKLLEKEPSLKKAEIHACPEEEVAVSIDLDRLFAQKIPLNQVLGAIQSNNVNIPGGNVDIGTKRFNVTTHSDLSNLEELRNTVISTSADGRIVRLRDVATANFALEKNNAKARFNGQNAVWVIAKLKDKKNLLQTDNELKPILDTFQRNLPEGIQMHLAFDQAESVRKRLSGFGIDFAIAIGLVLLTLLPLGWRASLVVMISIPLSLAIGLALLDFVGFTINQLSIVGMVVALGLLVDDSIVVVENIERFLRMGYSRKDAAVAATKQIGVAVIGCTATLVLAFLPLAFLPESSGDFIRSLPMAVLLTVLASLFVALTIIPFLSSLILSPHEKSEGNFFLRAFKRFVNQPYQHVLRWSFRHPILTLVGTLSVFLASLALVPVIGFSLFPKSEKPMFLVAIETPLGTSQPETDRVARIVENALFQHKQVRSVATNIGEGNPRVYYNVFQREASPNYAELFVQTQEMPLRKIEALCDSLREEFGAYPGARIEVKQFEQGPPTAAPIEIRLLGDQLDTLRHLAAQVETMLDSTPGLIYVRNPLAMKKTDLVVRINYDKAGQLGVAPSEIARNVRMGMAGLNIGQMRSDEGKDYTIRASVSGTLDQALQIFERIHVQNVQGTMIPLSEVARVELGTSPSVIRHFNKERYTAVTAFVKTGFNTASITDALMARLDKFPFPEGYGYVAAGERESSQESFGGMGGIIIVAVFGLLAILVLEFRNFKSTLIVLSVVPLGTIGALVTLFLVGKTLSFVATVGLIALVGIEIKNSILLVDYTNQLRAEGKSLVDAILEGAETRFLPILLTTLTAIGGMIPLVLEDAPLYSPLAWVLIGGLISSTLLSRLVTPLLYKLLPPTVDVKEQE